MQTAPPILNHSRVSARDREPERWLLILHGIYGTGRNWASIARRLVEERGRLVARLTELPVTVWPSAANFVLFRPVAADGAAVWKALLDRSVLVRDCSSWPRLEGCLRVTIGTPAEDDAFLAALEEVLS